VLAARVGRIAAIAQCLPTARAHLRAILPHESEEEILRAVPLEGVQHALGWLRERYGVELTVQGRVAVAKEPRWDPAQSFQPLRGVSGVVARAVAGAERAALLEAHQVGAACGQRTAVTEAHARHAVRLRSAAGQGVHEWTTECPADECLRLKDREFEFAARWRLGLPVMQAGDCKHRAAKDAESTFCGRRRDRLGYHAMLCGKGAGRYRVHGALCRRLARIARSCGVEAETEAVCPELLRGRVGAADSTEARLDVRLWSAGPDPLDEWIDVTVTHPFPRQAV